MAAEAEGAVAAAVDSPIQQRLLLPYVAVAAVDAAGGAQSKLVEPKISIGADTNTNSLIVRAQPNQIEELRRLVEDIDEVGRLKKEDFAYSSSDGVVNATLFKDSITRILGPKAVTNISSTATPSNNATQPTQTAAAPGGSDDAATQCVAPPLLR